MNISEYQAQIETEVKAEVLSQNPVFKRVKFANFVSYSKGRNRKRKRPAEIRLVSFNNQQRFYLWNNAPFDVYASEILGFSNDRDNMSPEEYLRQEILRIWGY